MGTRTPKKKSTAKMRDWKVIGNIHCPGLMQLHGCAHEHPSMYDGDFVYTTCIEGVSEDLRTVTTYNTIYTLEGDGDDQLLKFLHQHFKK